MRTSVRDFAGLGVQPVSAGAEHRNLRLSEAAAAELPKVSLEDALAILIVLAQRETPGSIARLRGGSGGCSRRPGRT